MPPLILPSAAPAAIDPRIKSLIGSPSPIDTVDSPALTSTIAAPSPAPPALDGAVTLPRAPLTQTQLDTNERNRLVNSPDGISQIKNPLLKGIARTADIAASVFSPLTMGLTGNLARAIPGTLEHHDYLVNRAQRNVANDQANDQAQATLTDSQAQARQRSALATQEEAKAYALTHPKPVAPEQEKPENLQQEHADAVIDAIHRGVDPAQDPKVQQLADAIMSLQRTPAPKEPNKDDKYIAINSKLAAGQPLTPDETAFKAGYEHYVKVNKLDPAGVRVSALLQMPQAIVDPNDPNSLVYTTKKGAVGQKAPGSNEVKAQGALLKSMTSGDIAKNLTAFNTASAHLDQLDKAVDALNNGDIQVLNRIGNEFAKQTGSPAPTNFQAVKSAVAGEVSKTFKGGQATDAEIKEFEGAISSANSPQQLKQVIQTYKGLMASKRDALRQQVEMGQKGQANFGEGESSGAAEEYVRDANGKLVKKGGK